MTDVHELDDDTLQGVVIYYVSSAKSRLLQWRGCPVETQAAAIFSRGLITQEIRWP